MQTKEKMVIGYWNWANYITLLGLTFSLLSCFFVLSGNVNLSIISLVISGICDLFDGAIARKIKRTDSEKEFGVQLDTVVDVVSFGITPIIIAFSTVSTAWYALVIYTFYAACAVIRLAYFNTTTVSNVTAKYYYGLPVTYIALILPIVLLFHSALASIIALAATGILFILNIKIPKPRGIWYAIFPIIAVVLIILWRCL